jgi:hypothetical protein
VREFLGLASPVADPVVYRRDRRKDQLLQENGYFVLRSAAEWWIGRVPRRSVQKKVPGTDHLVWLDLRAAPSVCSPERVNDHLVVVERVVEVERRPPEVHATDSGDW